MTRESSPCRSRREDDPCAENPSGRSVRAKHATEEIRSSFTVSPVPDRRDPCGNASCDDRAEQPDRASRTLLRRVRRGCLHRASTLKGGNRVAVRTASVHPAKRPRCVGGPVNLSMSDGNNYNRLVCTGRQGQPITSLIGQLDALNIPVIAATGNSFTGVQGEGFPAIVSDLTLDHRKRHPALERRTAPRPGVGGQLGHRHRRPGRGPRCASPGQLRHGRGHQLRGRRGVGGGGPSPARSTSRRSSASSRQSTRSTPGSKRAPTRSVTSPAISPSDASISPRPPASSTTRRQVLIPPLPAQARTQVNLSVSALSGSSNECRQYRLRLPRFPVSNRLSSPQLDRNVHRDEYRYTF